MKKLLTLDEIKNHILNHPFNYQHKNGYLMFNVNKSKKCIILKYNNDTKQIFYVTNPKTGYSAILFDNFANIESLEPVKF